jgi:hypothetical protein
MNDSYEAKIHDLKYRQYSRRRLIVLLMLAAVTLVLLCGAVNFTFFAAGYAFNTIWPFVHHPPAPHMIAAYQANQIPEPPPVTAVAPIYSQTFPANPLADWHTFADGWDVLNGVYYGSNTRAEVRSEAVYGQGYRWANYALEADVTVMGTAAPASAGLLFRYQEDGYSGHCRLGTRATGQRQLELMTPEGQLLATSFHFVTGEAYRLRATAVDNTLTCEIVGYPDSKLSATTAVLQGTIGLQNRSITGAFDNLEVSVLP